MKSHCPKKVKTTTQLYLYLSSLSLSVVLTVDDKLFDSPTVFCVTNIDTKVDLSREYPSSFWFPHEPSLYPWTVQLLSEVFQCYAEVVEVRKALH